MLPDRSKVFFTTPTGVEVQMHNWCEECVSFTLFTEPPTSTSQGASMILKTKTGRLFFGKPAKSPAAKWKKEWVANIASVAERVAGLPAEVLGRWSKPEACAVHIVLGYPHPASTKKADRNSTVPRTTKPDLDNLAKMFLDGLTEGGLIEDDRHIAALHLHKFNCPQPHICVSVHNLLNRRPVASKESQRK